MDPSDLDEGEKMQLCVLRERDRCRGGIRSPDLDVCIMVSVHESASGGRALPWMQITGSSVLMSPLHSCDIVAALLLS